MVMAFTMALSISPVSDAEADVVVLGGQGGTIGTIANRSGNTMVASDSHKAFGPAQGWRPPASNLILHLGQSPQRTSTPFGIPPPPSSLTPAPVLPFYPHSPLMPGSAADSAPFTLGAHGATDGFHGR